MIGDIVSAMLFGAMKEAQNPDCRIEIPDVTPIAFEFLLKYVHCINPSINIENITQVFYMSKKYLLNDIAHDCILFLSDLANNEEFNVEILAILIQLWLHGFKVA